MAVPRPVWSVHRTQRQPLTTRATAQGQKSDFVFTSENFRKPDLPRNLKVLDVPLEVATDEALEGTW